MRAGIMRGEYDNELEWPIEGSITVQLVNTEQVSGHRTVTMGFPRPIERETKYEMADWGFGVEEFISHKELFNKAAAIHPYADSQYVLNDCMHLRIVNVTGYLCPIDIPILPFLKHLLIFTSC